MAKGTPLNTSENCTVDFLVLARLRRGLSKPKQNVPTSTTVKPIIIEPTNTTDCVTIPLATSPMVEYSNVAPSCSYDTGPTETEQPHGLPIIEPQDESDVELNSV